MKGKIIVLGSEGVLMIGRGNQMRVQSCPFQSMQRDRKVPNYNDIVREPVARPCGDWCPLFGEPEKRPKYTYLILCHRMIEFAEFTDERGKE